ncbi:MAG: HAMP domain-containing sensor histidine kinase [Candidatus Krumholzibacteria bacterium]|nr:HAMP domain-containing sensor histidine kinase [Candidatus Krumholzibacteria bacterium]
MLRSRWLTKLHVRVPALFLGLVVLVGAVYYLWMERTVFRPPQQDPAEADWYSELAAVEIDSVAALAASLAPDRLQDLAQEYGAAIAVFAAEIVFFDATSGKVIAACAPDSLPAAVGEVDPELLAGMAEPGWAFDKIYPDPTNIEAYVNRIFHVAAVAGPDGAPIAYLAGSWRPLIFALEDVTLNPRQLWLQAILVGLAGSFLVGWIVLAWLTRRIQTLNTAAAALAAGRLDHRVQDKSADDLGHLGRAFNSMATRLESLITELRNKEQFQRQLIANISHDLRTPMASLRGYVETLGLRAEQMDRSEFQRYLGIIDDNLSHLDRLVDHLLQISRLDAGQARFQFEEFLLPELIEGVLTRCEVSAAARGIRLECRYPAELPLVNADPLQIAQVVQNLMENGIKFGRDGGEVVVSLATLPDRTVEVAVCDDGPGIDSQDLPHIFERFFTGDRSRSRKGQSSGLGLAIAAKIVEEHGSRLTVASEPGRGAAFRFQLPAVNAAKANSAES